MTGILIVNTSRLVEGVYCLSLAYPQAKEASWQTTMKSLMEASGKQGNICYETVMFGRVTNMLDTAAIFVYLIDILYYLISCSLIPKEIIASDQELNKIKT